MSSHPSNPTILIDTREQRPYSFAAAGSVRQALPAGDYSLLGWETRVAIERKTLDDYIATIIHAHGRFGRELAQLRDYTYAWIVVEGSLEDVLLGRYRSRATPQSILGMTAALMTAYQVPVLFAHTRPCARALVEALLLQAYLDRTAQAGYRHQLRFDLSEADLKKQMDGFALKHCVTGGNDLVGLVDTMLGGNGAFVSTVEKMRVGVPVGGMSPVEDMSTGGATYFFTRIDKHPSKSKRPSEGFYFKINMLRRMDAISYDHDAFGKVIGDYVEEHRQSTVQAWKDIHAKSGNETIFKYSVTLLDNIDVIVVKSAEKKRRLLNVFKQHGVSVLPDGRRVDEIILTRE